MVANPDGAVYGQPAALEYTWLASLFTTGTKGTKGNSEKDLGKVHDRLVC